MLNPLQLSGVCVTHDAQQRSEVLLAALRGSTLAAKVKRELKDEVIKNKYTAASFSGSTALAALMDSMRLTAKLNAGVACLQSDIARALSRSHTHGVPIPVSNTESHHSDTPHQQQQQQHHHHHQVYPPVPTPDETLESVLRGRREWREKLAARVKRLSVELDAPLARLRTPRTEAGRQAREKEDREAVNLCTFIDSQQQAAKLGADSDAAGTGPKSGKPGAPKQAPVRCIREDGSIFNAALLYAHVVGMRPSNHAFEAAKFSGWSVIKHELDTPSIDDLCKLYDDMKPSYRQCGVDDASNERFYDNTTKLFRGALARGDVASVRSLARRGVPVALRQLVWRTLLEPTLAHDQSTKEKKDAYLRLLQQDVLHAELLVDDVVRWDVRECASNDKYFVFDDTLERILLPLIRDPYCCPYVRQAFRPLSGQDHSGATILEAYPPSGIVPHAGIADLCAPLCFVFTGLSEVYFVFRCFYCRYWLQLQTLASKGENIQTLCKLFERLVQAYNPEVAFHCVSVGLNPLEVVFPWIFTAFSGYLEVEQVLHLWDRILAYDSLWLLSVLAAAVFLWRGRSVLQAETPADIRALFVDFSKLQVVPLLQYFLFA